MHVHILGIGGTFMGGVAALAKAAGHRVSGADRPLYPPMSEQLLALGIGVHGIEDMAQFRPQPDVVIIGNVMSRGAPAVEWVLNEGLAFTSGPAWLAEHVLRPRHVVGVAGTHGKTTTASLLTWLLQSAGCEPGYLIGGVPRNFPTSARLGRDPYFVVEADEYDTAFFDKRSKFVHYGARTLVLNNLEFDHADIFPDLAAIKTQFHHLLRTVPGNGKLVINADDAALADVLEQGTWTPQVSFGAAGTWRATAVRDRLRLEYGTDIVGDVPWRWPGEHNAANAAAACAAAHELGLSHDALLQGLSSFAGVRRRAELMGTVAGVHVYDDFAHHPTAIRLTLEGFRGRVGDARLLAIVELRSYTMKMGVHNDVLAAALTAADHAWVFVGDTHAPGVGSIAALGADVFDDHARLMRSILDAVRGGDHVVIMSNGGFEGFHQRFLGALAERKEQEAR